MDRDMSPIPDGSGVGDVARAALEEARRDATLALIAAEKAERTAKEARKRATWKIKKYERLVQEFGGQMKLPL